MKRTIYHRNFDYDLVPVEMTVKFTDGTTWEVFLDGKKPRMIDYFYTSGSGGLFVCYSDGKHEQLIGTCDFSISGLSKAYSRRKICDLMVGKYNEF